MEITRDMSELIISYSIAFARAVSFEQLVEADAKCLNEISELYHKRELSLEQVQFMISYFNEIITDSEAHIERFCSDK